MPTIEIRKRSRTVPLRHDEDKILRYLGAFLVAFTVSLVALVCFKFIFTCIAALIDCMIAFIENINRSTHTIVIQRSGEEFYVRAQIDPKHQISEISPTSQQGTCVPRDTVRDFEKGTEVFSEGNNCFVRFFNQSEESYDQQMLLFEILNDLPLQQSADPLVYQASQQLQFTDGLYDLLGGRVAARCDRRRLLWIFPASAQLAPHLTTCRCFDTAHARLSVCLHVSGEQGGAPRLWTDEPGEFQTERSMGETPRGEEPRRGIDSIVMKPDMRME